LVGGSGYDDETLAISKDMDLEVLTKLQGFCRDEAAFEQLKQTLT
jgi:hypothetical protein